jgi:hypothetical protein
MAFNEERAGKMLRATDTQLIKIYLGGSLASAAARREILARGLPLPRRVAKKT